MSDSFFTSRNQVDAQIETSNAIFCNDLIEASTRRLAKIEGPLEASKSLQRIADICAGAYVLPMEHWAKLGKVEETPAPEPTPPEIPRWRIDQHFNRFAAKNPLVLFYVGLFIGMAINTKVSF